MTFSEKRALNRERYLTADEAAIILGVCPGTVRRLSREGKIKAYKIGKLWRYKKEELHNAD